MSQRADKEHLAKAVVDARSDFDRALHDKRRYPREQFQRFFAAVKAYADATTHDKMIHRDVVRRVSGLREYLQIERKRVPGDVLFDADRLETILFEGYDPSFEGDEPPDL